MKTRNEVFRMGTRGEAADLVLYELCEERADGAMVILEIDFHDNGTADSVALNATELRKLDEAIGKMRQARLGRGRKGL